MKYFKLYVRPFLSTYKMAISLTILLGLIAVLSAAMLTFTAGYLISRASTRPETILLLSIPIVLVRTFGLSRAVAHYIERLIGHNVVLKILAEMRVGLYKMLEPQALFIRSRFQTGDLLGALADDIEHLQDVYIRTIFPAVIGFCLFLYATIMLAVFDWKFALWTGICLSIIVFVYPFYSLKKLKQHQIQIKAKRSQMYQDMTDAIFGISDWMISGRKADFTEGFVRDSTTYFQSEQKLSKFTRARGFHLQVLAAGIVVFTSIWTGNAAAAGNLAPAYIAAFTLVALPIMESLLPVSEAIERIPTYADSFKRMERIRQFMPPADDQTEVISLGERFPLQLKDVHYRYGSQNQDALAAIQLNIAQGEKVAILGKSGAGKSTLLQLIQGSLTPTNGTVLLGGKAPASYGEQIYKIVGVLNQKPYLFATTIENNIRLGNQQATEAEVMDVIKQVRLDEYISRLPLGMKTQMEEAGQRFSGGERQRIALARILLQDTPIVILDEPTIGLDPITEKELMETIFTTLTGKTIIWITHHLTGMEAMDQVLFLDEGRVSIHGKHKELLDNNQRYQQLYQLDRGDVLQS